MVKGTLIPPMQVLPLLTRVDHWFAQAQQRCEHYSMHTELSSSIPLALELLRVACPLLLVAGNAQPPAPPPSAGQQGDLQEWEGGPGCIARNVAM